MKNTFIGGSQHTPKRPDNWLTKREHFAGLALQGLCASSLRDNKQGWDIEAYAIEAVALADELIKQLNENSNEATQG